jgi:hypothetical protein
MRTQFSEMVQFKAPDGFWAAVSAAASREYCSVSEYIRRCVIGCLREAGVSIEPGASPQIDQTSEAQER